MRTSSAASPKVYWISPSDTFILSPLVRRTFWPLLLIFAGMGLLLAYFLLFRGTPEATNPGQTSNAESLSSVDSGSESQPTPTAKYSPTIQNTQAVDPVPVEPTQTPQPVIPTRTRDVTQTPDETNDSHQNIESEAVSATNSCNLQDCSSRFGTSGRQEQIGAAHSAGLPFGVYLTWYTEPSPPKLHDVQFWQMVNITEAGPVQSTAMIEEVIAANPGAVWIVGNEPDVVWQDNVTAERYAEIYHDVYSTIKQQDPTAQVAIAGVAQPTPLRLSYLDKVLGTYQALYNESLPVDIWTIHAFILREEADSWGVGIPPGLDELKGELYEIEDHNNIEVFGQNLIAFRAWMAKQGYAEKPLAVTEFGILHPSDYGFPPEVVAAFMVGAFDFFMTATNDTGYPADDYRLVQWWFWYSVYDGGDFPTGNLYDPEQDTLTSAGKTYSAYVKGEQ